MCLCALARRQAETDGTKLVRDVLKEIRGVEADFAREEQRERKRGGASLRQWHFLGSSTNYHTIALCRGHILLGFFYTSYLTFNPELLQYLLQFSRRWHFQENLAALKSKLGSFLR